MAKPQATYVGSLNGNNQAALKEFVVTTGATITKGDFVTLESGCLTVSSANDNILGVANETITTAAAGSKIEVIVDPLAVYLIEADNDTTTTAVTDTGKYFQLVGTTGAMYVDSNTVSATVGNVCMIDFNPRGNNTAEIHVVIARHQLGGAFEAET